MHAPSSPITGQSGAIPAEYTAASHSLLPTAIISLLFVAACVVIPIRVQDQRKQDALTKRMDVCLANSPACDLPASDVAYARRHQRNVALYERLETGNIRAWEMQRKAEQDAAEVAWQKESAELDKELGLTGQDGTP